MSIRAEVSMLIIYPPDLHVLLFDGSGVDCNPSLLLQWGEKRKFRLCCLLLDFKPNQPAQSDCPSSLSLSAALASSPPFPSVVSLVLSQPPPGPATRFSCCTAP